MLPLELVIVENEVPKTTSLLVAKFFGKRHSEVLRKIDLLDCSKEFSERNFASADYLDEHQPAFFMRNQETKDLIAELENETKLSSANLQTIIKKITGKGLHQGTYACKEIVYRYAMWISPKFALAVIRVFDAYVTGKLEPKAKPKPQSLTVCH